MKYLLDSDHNDSIACSST